MYLTQPEHASQAAEFASDAQVGTGENGGGARVDEATRAYGQRRPEIQHVCSNEIHQWAIDELAEAYGCSIQVVRRNMLSIWVADGRRGVFAGLWVFPPGQVIEFDLRLDPGDFIEIFAQAVEVSPSTISWLRDQNFLIY